MPRVLSKPITRSASRTAETSGVVTIIASSAAAAAFLKPSSMPAGASIKITSKCGFIISTIFCMSSGFSQSSMRGFPAGNSDKFGSCLCLTIACSSRQLPASTSWAVKTILFSSPSNRSRLRRPKSASRTAVRTPWEARAIPRFAVRVVLPTPPLPEQIRIVCWEGAVTYWAPAI